MQFGTDPPEFCLAYLQSDDSTHFARCKGARLPKPNGHCFQRSKSITCAGIFDCRQQIASQRRVGWGWVTSDEVVYAAPRAAGEDGWKVVQAGRRQSNNTVRHWWCRESHGARSRRGRSLCRRRRDSHGASVATPYWSVAARVTRAHAYAAPHTSSCSTPNQTSLDH